MRSELAQSVRCTLLCLSVSLALAAAICLPVLAQSKTQLSAVPAGAQGPISAALGKNDSGYWARANAQGFHAENARQVLSADFSRQGAAISSRNQHWTLETQADGYGNALHPLKSVAPQATANRVEYRRDGVTEWYENGPLGLEQGFTLADRPRKPAGKTSQNENSLPLTLELALRGDLLAKTDATGKSLELRSKDGRAALRYTGLKATDATGRELQSRLEVRNECLLLRINDVQAKYPIVVDPWIQQAELTSSDGAANDSFGWSVAISGSTLVVGASSHKVGSNSGQGAAYVFTQNGTNWNQQAELTAPDGAANDSFGFSVAISGGTLVVGAPGHQVGSNLDQGAAYVFAQSGTTWTQQAELTSFDGATNDFFGYSVAISGGRLVVGAPNHPVGSNSQQGAAYVFAQDVTIWNQQAEPTASDGASGDFFGYSVAISGTTIAVGAPGHQVGSNSGQGAAYVFTESGTIWTQQAEPTAPDGATDDFFGNSVAISGSTLVSGAPGHQVGSNSLQGAAYVFTQSGTTWAQQTEPTASDGAADDSFGYFVAISGSTLVVSAPFRTVGSNSDQGAAYVFTQSGTTWTQQAEPTASDGASGDSFGNSVAISGSTLVVGAPFHSVGSNPAQGAAYVFVSPPISFSPGSLSFGNQNAYTTSPPQTVTITNTGTSAADSVDVTTSEYFEVSATTCGSTLAAGASCTVSVTFTPTVSGPITGILVMNSSAYDGPLTVSLSGTGVYAATVSVTPASLSFGKHDEYTSSTPKSVTIKNTSSTVLNFRGFSIGGTSDFQITANTCGATLAASKTCKVSVVFTPTVAGAESATLLISDDASGGLQTVALSGTGVAEVTITPATYTFPNTTVGTTSTNTFTVTNDLSSAITIDSYFATPPPFSVLSSTCGTTLNGKKSCNITVEFAPTQTGPASGGLYVENSTADAVVTAILQGVGQ